MKQRRKLSERQRQYIWWGFWIVLILVVYFSLNWLTGEALRLLQVNPDVWAFYKSIEYEIASRSLLGLFIACAIGATFLVAIPVEAAFLFYLGIGYPLLTVFGIALAGILVGDLFNYFIGWLIGPKPVKMIIKEKYGVFSRKIGKAGAFIIVIGNILPPFPSDLFSLFTGTVRYGMFRMLFYTVIGRAIQFLLLWLGYTYFVQYAVPYIGTLTPDWFYDLIRSSFTG